MDSWQIPAPERTRLDRTGQRVIDTLRWRTTVPSSPSPKSSGSLLAATDDVRPDQERARLLGLALFGIIALGHIPAAVLLPHGRQIGRWIGLLAAFVILALGLSAQARSEADDRSVGIVLVMIVAVRVLLVGFGARVSDQDERRAQGPAASGPERV
jgi:hypothetical protein